MIWMMKLSGGGGYNDPTEYNIIDGEGKKIAYVMSVETANRIIEAHNKAIFEMLKASAGGTQ